jgi:hypothetical protein
VLQYGDGPLRQRPPATALQLGQALGGAAVRRNSLAVVRRLPSHCQQRGRLIQQGKLTRRELHGAQPIGGLVGGRPGAGSTVRGHGERVGYRSSGVSIRRERTDLGEGLDELCGDRLPDIGEGRAAQHRLRIALVRGEGHRDRAMTRRGSAPPRSRSGGEPSTAAFDNVGKAGVAENTPQQQQDQQ